MHWCRYVPNAQVAFEYPNDFVTEEDINANDPADPAAAELQTEASPSVVRQPDGEPSDAELQAAEKG